MDIFWCIFESIFIVEILFSSINYLYYFYNIYIHKLYSLGIISLNIWYCIFHVYSLNICHFTRSTTLRNFSMARKLTKNNFDYWDSLLSYINWTMIKLNDEPKARPIPKNAAIIDDAISFSWLLTDLKRGKGKKVILVVLIWKFDFETYFGAQIMAILAK